MAYWMWMVLLYDVLQVCNTEIINVNNGTTGEIICKPSEDCFIDCNTEQSCFDLYITCPQDRKCIIACKQEGSCNYMIINATKSSALTIIDCDVDNDSCTNVTVHCSTWTIFPISCTVSHPCHDICNTYTNSDDSESYASQSIWEIILTLNVLYYIIGILILAICCCCCIVLFYIQMSLSYNKKMLKYQMNIQISKIKSASNSSISAIKPAKFVNENREKINIIALKVPQQSSSLADNSSPYNSDDEVLEHPYSPKQEDNECITINPLASIDPIHKRNNTDILQYKKRDNIINHEQKHQLPGSNIISFGNEAEIISNIEIQNNEPNTSVSITNPASPWSNMHSNNHLQHPQEMNQFQTQSIHKESINTTVSELTSVTASTLPTIPEPTKPKVSLDSFANTSTTDNIYSSDTTDTTSSSENNETKTDIEINRMDMNNQMPVIFANDQEQIEYYRMLQKDRNTAQLKFAMNFLNHQNGNFVERNRDSSMMSENIGGDVNQNVECNDNMGMEPSISGIVSGVLGNMFGVKDDIIKNENVIMSNNEMIEK